MTPEDEILLGRIFILYPLLTWAWAYLQAQGWLPTTVTAPPLLDVEALMVLLTGTEEKARLRLLDGGGRLSPITHRLLRCFRRYS